MSGNVKGYTSLIIAAMLFAVGATAVKMVSQDFSGVFVALARFAVGAVLSVGFSFAFRVPLRVTNWGALAGRGFFGAVAMTLYYLGIAWTSSGRATLLMNVAPVFILIIGTLFFSEPFHWASLAGLLACMAGAILILYDGTSYPLAGSLACLAGAFFRDFAINFVRRLRTSQHSSYLVYLSACVFGIPFTLHSAGEARTLSWSHAGPLLFVSVIMFGAQIFMGYGYKHTTATTGSLLSYLVIPMVVVLSAVVVDEQITARFLAGAAVIAGGLIVGTVLAGSEKKRVRERNC